MRAGTLRHSVTVQRPALPTNNGGTPVPSAATVLYALVPAEVQSANAREMERVFGAQVQSTASHIVRMRYLALRLTDEIVWHDGDTDRTLRISGRHEDAQKRELTLAVQEHIQ